MRIAQVAPLFESVPPKLYGGTERVVSYLTEALVELGHEVTLFASGDSRTTGRLVPGWPRALRLDGRSDFHVAPHLLELEQVFRRRSEFDIAHFHTDPLHYPFVRRYPLPHLTTLHGRLDLPELAPLMHEYRDVPLVSVSASQRQPLPGCRWQATVHHGLPRHLFHLQQATDGYLAFLGRISPEKRVDRAIEIALRLQTPLRIAAKVDNADKVYFRDRIEPLLAHPLVDFIGEIGESEKQELLGRAEALLFPIDWPEPFGLVMIEALACGTPVVAWNCGSVPEVIEPGVTGFVVNSVDEAVEAVREARKLSRRRCRQRFEHRFTAEGMARNYLSIYERLVEQNMARQKVEVSDA
ncbi:MAG TPA: glycosyltransferase family 4 protein [Ideonella sp.]|uniref:glycosyltransferase family 4 protein n=1 Tax=Ideonella sp. TaxID=1929293 RepID=UPI002E3809DF|nr:glycosyltransferase family 4 protein [Ideonella sp.]HEX5685395.1 glycosyltransferase family 4 protein [Ideonella sp.]